VEVQPTVPCDGAAACSEGGGGGAGRMVVYLSEGHSVDVICRPVSVAVVKNGAAVGACLCGWV